MGTHDPRIDAYIEKAAPFAQPILRHIRAVVHEACPAATETIKWGMPHFEHKGVLCNMAAFKAHCAVGFWKGSLLFEENERPADAMGHFGRITSIDDLPKKRDFIALVKKAAKLNEDGVQRPKGAATTPKPELEPPDDLMKALANNRAAMKVFESFAPSHRREYIGWITEAKTAPTRQKRIDQAVEWIAEGKQRNWKYMKK